MRVRILLLVLISLSFKASDANAGSLLYTESNLSGKKQRSVENGYGQLLDKLHAIPAGTRYALVNSSSAWTKEHTSAILIVESQDGIDVFSYKVYLPELRIDKIREVHLPKPFETLLEELNAAGLKSLTDHSQNPAADSRTYYVSVNLATETRRFSVYHPEGFATLAHCNAINILFAKCDPDPKQCVKLRCIDYPPKYPKGYPE